MVFYRYILVLAVGDQRIGNSDIIVLKAWVLEDQGSISRCSIMVLMGWNKVKYRMIISYLYLTIIIVQCLEVLDWVSQGK